jgi:transposase
MCGSGARWCARADAIFDIPDMHVLDVEVDERSRLVLTVESGRLEQGCPWCGVLAVGHGRRVRQLHDAPCFGRVTFGPLAGADLALPRAGVRDGHVQ